MELGPVFRAVMHQKGRFWLVALEVAITLAIVVNCVNLALDLKAKYSRPTGLAEEEILVVRIDPFAPEFSEEDYRDVVRERDLEALRALPGVRAATAIHQVPLSGGGSATGRRARGTEDEPSTTPYFVVSSGAIEALGVELVAGRDFTEAELAMDTEDFEGETTPAIVSRAHAEKVFGDPAPLGKVMESTTGESSEYVVGVVDRMPNSWPDNEENAEYAVLMSGRPGSARRAYYLVRAEPGAVEAVFPMLDEAVLGVEPGRIVEVETMVDVKRDTFSANHALVKILSAIIALLVFVTGLGVVGLTSFSVTQRRRQIGTRRALGATRGAILRYFLVENWLVIGLGLVLGVGLTYGLNYALAEAAAAPKLGWELLAGGAALLWAAGLAAALWPAVRATRVAPVVATRTV